MWFFFLYPSPVSNKAFPYKQTILDYMRNDLQVADLTRLQPREKSSLHEFLKGLKVDYEVKGERRTHRVNGLGRTAIEHRYVA